MACRLNYERQLAQLEQQIAAVQHQLISPPPLPPVQAAAATALPQQLPPAHALASSAQQVAQLQWQVRHGLAHTHRLWIQLQLYMAYTYVCMCVGVRVRACVCIWQVGHELADKHRLERAQLRGVSYKE